MKKPNAVKMILVVFVFGSVTSVAIVSSVANARTQAVPCLSGVSLDRAQEAEGILKEALRGVAFFRGQSIEDALKSSQTPVSRAEFRRHLGEAMTDRYCKFAPGARYDTVDETLDSIAERSIQIPFSTHAPAEIKPGFKAVLGAVNSSNLIFIEVTRDGFVFHSCETNPNEVPGNPPPPVSAQCPLLMNAPVFIPADEMVERTTGFASGFLIGLKAAAGSGIILAQSLGTGIVAAAATGATNLLAPAPLTELRRNRDIDQTFHEVFANGALAAQEGYGGLIYKLLPNEYDDLKSGLQHLIGVIYQREFKLAQRHMRDNPDDPNNQADPAAIMNRRYGKMKNAEFKTADEKSATDPEKKAPVLMGHQR
jgi:hypothetical protein